MLPLGSPSTTYLAENLNSFIVEVSKTVPKCLSNFESSFQKKSQLNFEIEHLKIFNA